MNRNLFTRRRFLKTLGLGAGASLLMPLSDRLVSTALGMDMPPQKRLLLMSVYMMEPTNYMPAEAKGVHVKESIAPLVPAAWPSIFAPMSAYMDRAVFVDGLRNWIGTHQHRSGTAALSCVKQTDGKPERMGPAGRLTIDQHIANTLSDKAPHRSMNWAVTGDGIDGGRKTGSSLFATGREQNLTHFESAQEMMDRFYPDPMMGAGDGGEGGTNSFRPLRDRLVDDLGRMRSRLAAEEHIALDAYEQSILDFDKRQEALSMVSCGAPGSAPENKNAQQHMSSMMAQSQLGLQCGLTNVVAISIGMSGNHNKHMPRYDEVAQRSSDPNNPGSFYGHGASGDNQPRAMEARRIFHEIHMRELAQVLDALSQVTESDGNSIADHTAVVYTTCNGHTNGGHHAGKGGENLWPAFLVAGKETGFDTGGRYMSCGRHQHGNEKWALSDFYKSLALGLGVDASGYGDDEHGSGRLDQILNV